jgi:hypothetical protein
MVGLFIRVNLNHVKKLMHKNKAWKEVGDSGNSGYSGEVNDELVLFAFSTFRMT